MSKLMIIEDDPDLGMILSRYLNKKGYENTLATSGKEGIKHFTAHPPDLLLTDYKLGDMDATEVILAFRKMYPYIPIIVMTGYADIQTAVHVMKIGASDYLAKPIIPNDLIVKIDEILNKVDQNQTKLEKENQYLSKIQIQDDSTTVKSKSSPKWTQKFVLGDSKASTDLYRMIDIVAPTDYSVIIYGESGVGKESVANLIHKQSKRNNHPFVAIDCGALPKDLANSELFGYEKGAFTGALQQKIGLFEAANGGTIFLDEIANLPYDVQIALLRLVQERKLKRIGGIKDIDVNIRIIVASNENLIDAATKGKFREDLYHRFNEFSITVPTLRERGTDILKLATAFLKNSTIELDKDVIGLSTEVQDVFLKYPWYGNVRELKNIIKRAVLLTNQNIIEVSDLPIEMINGNFLFPKFKQDGTTISEINPNQVDPPHLIEVSKDLVSLVPDHTDLKTLTQNTEYKMIMKALMQSSFNKSKAAKILNIDRKTLYNKMKFYNIN